MQMTKSLLMVCGMVFVLGACDNDDAKLIPNAPRYGLDNSITTGSAAQSNATLPGVTSGDWPTHLGRNSHVQSNAAFDGSANLVVRYNLGAMPRGAALGASAPIVVGDRIYHYDAAGRLHALNFSGGRFWVTNLTPVEGRPGDGFGGGLAYANGVIYAATGYGEVVAVNASTGGISWRYKHSSPLRRAPIVENGRVIVISKGSEALALNASDGTVAWRKFGAGSTAPSRLNSGVPAAANGKTVLAYASGTLSLNNVTTGVEDWLIPTIGDEFVGETSVFGDVSGDPVIAGNQLILGTRGGVQARSLSGGQLNWSNRLGTNGALVVAGNSVYGISASNTLYRLDINNGTAQWSIRLPVKGGSGSFSGPQTQYLDPRLAGSRILALDSHKILRQYDVNSGGLVASTELPEQFTTTPIAANGSLIGIGESGNLLIYR